MHKQDLGHPVKENLAAAEEWSKVSARKFCGSSEITSTRNHDPLWRMCFVVEDWFSFTKSRAVELISLKCFYINLFPNY